MKRANRIWRSIQSRLAFCSPFSAAQDGSKLGHEVVAFRDDQERTEIRHD